MAKKAKTPQEIDAFRQRVCEAATQLFIEHGPQNVTMRQIAKALGVSPMTPYGYFRDKEEILATVRAAAYNQFAETLEQAVSAAPNARAKGRAVGDAYVGFAQRFPSAYQLIFSFAQADQEDYPELRQAQARARATMVDYVRDMVAAGLLDGDPELIGHMFWAALHGVVMLELTGGLSGISKLNSDTLRDKLMRTLYAGMKTHPATLTD